MTADVLERPGVDLERLLDDGLERSCELLVISRVLGSVEECSRPAEWVVYAVPSCGHARPGSSPVCDPCLRDVQGDVLFGCHVPACDRQAEIRSVERLR